MDTRRLILFTRYPIPGFTKTRLIPALGERGAADLQSEMTEHTLDSIRPMMDEGIHIEVRYEGGDTGSMAEWLGEDLSFVPQGGGDLGARMERAFREAFNSGEGKALIIGSDCPDMGAADIREGFVLLDSNPVVLGPATDGGYYLVGIRAGALDRLFESLFSGIPWGSGGVLSNTVNALANAGIDLGLLDEKDDVDAPEDLVHWETIKAKIRTRTASTPSTASISVIVPVLNEEERICALIDALKAYNLEIIVVDGGSTDDTAAVCRSAGVRVVTTGSGRAAQMNAGAGAASGQILLFLHADTILPEGFPGMVRDTIAAGRVAGAFSFGTDLDNFSMRLFERTANIRSRLLGIVFGDQAVFARADVFRKIGGFPDIPVMEDMELVRALKKQGPFVILPHKVITSARRWQVNGVWRTALANQAVIWLYLLGASPERLARWYQVKLRVER